MLNILLNVVITVGLIFGAFNYVPLQTIESVRQSKKLGSTITTILGSDTLSSSRTTLNNNFSALNSTKIENSTTSVASITTLANLTSAASLATIGTITTGVWSGTAVLTAKGGTGSTTLSSNQILLGNGTGNIGIVGGYGTTGQFLTSTGVGTAPSWQTSAVDQTLNYTWTGTHNFTQNVGIGTSTPYANLSIAGASGVVANIFTATSSRASTFPYATTTMVSSATASTTNQIISGTCSGCILNSGYQIITSTGTFGGESPARYDATVSCPGSKIAISGGFNTADMATNGVSINYSVSTTTWRVRLAGTDGSTQAASTYVICINP